MPNWNKSESCEPRSTGSEAWCLTNMLRTWATSASPNEQELIRCHICLHCWWMFVPSAVDKCFANRDQGQSVLWSDPCRRVQCREMQRTLPASAIYNGAQYTKLQSSYIPVSITKWSCRPKCHVMLSSLGRAFCWILHSQWFCCLVPLVLHNIAVKIGHFRKHSQNRLM